MNEAIRTGEVFRLSDLAEYRDGQIVHVDVTDISKSGIGFDCKKKLEMNSYYDAKIQIWTKEVVDAVIQIVRSEEKPDGFHYGGVFIGMTDTDALKIDIYQIFNEL